MCLVFFFPIPGKAQAILVSSDPANSAVLAGAPAVVRMQFSEDLNPTVSSAVVVNTANHRVDLNDAQISFDDSQEMDVSLKDSLPSDVYIVIWRTQSADDGQVQHGSFLFKVMASNGDIPSLKEGTYPGQNMLGGGNTTGQMDGPTLFSLIIVTLVDLSVIFWVGAQLWRTFVSQSSDGDSTEQYAIDQSADRRFELFFSIPILLVTFVANLGVLMGQGLFLTGGDFTQVFPLFGKLMANGRFGAFWTMREIIVLLALVLAMSLFWSRRRSPIIDRLISWINLVFGLALLTTVALSSHAEEATSTTLVYAVLADWLHLLAASLWIGGMIYLVVVYLPILKGKLLAESTRALLTMLSHFLPLAIAGVVIIAITGPFNATVHMSTLDQLVTTAYGRALLVKIVCVGALLLITAIHVLLFRPRLNKTFDAYQVALSESQGAEVLEGSVTRQTRQLTKVLHWEALLGVAVLICVGSMNVFAGTLPPVAAQQNQSQTSQQLGAQGGPFNTTVLTTDGKLKLKLTITPNIFGTNLFIVDVLDSNGKQNTNAIVSLDLVMLDMNMGIESFNLQLNGKGEFSAKGDIGMDGNWEVRLQVHTSDNTVHEATVKFFTLY
jgi:copper transport protein